MNIFGIGLPEMAVIAAIGLLVFGPKRLPELGKTLGRTLKGFQSASQEFEQEFRTAITPPTGVISPTGVVSPTGVISSTVGDGSSLSAAADPAPALSESTPDPSVVQQSLETPLASFDSASTSTAG